MIWARMLAYITGTVDQERNLPFDLGSQDPVLCVAKPDTLLAWYRKLIANKFDGSKFRKSQGRPRVGEETERLVVRMAKENPGWGYDRIVGAMANLGLQLSDQTVGNILRRMIFHRLPNGSRQRVGKPLSVLTWRYWWRPTSSRWKCLRSEG